jgi:hypothetical protein
MDYDPSNPPTPAGVCAKEYLEKHPFLDICPVCHERMIPGNGVSLIFIGGMTDSLFHYACWSALYNKYCEKRQSLKE